MYSAAFYFTYQTSKTTDFIKTQIYDMVLIIYWLIRDENQCLISKKD